MTRYRVALTPEQKRMKKDYLLQQELPSQVTKLPTFEEVWKGYKYDTDIDDYIAIFRNEKFVRDRVYEEIVKQYEAEGVNEDDVTEEMIEERYDDVVPDIIFEDVLRDEIEERFDNAVYRIENELDGENCWRVITVGPKTDPTKLTQLGIYWAYDEGAAYAHWGKSSHERKVKFEAVIDIQYVDLEGTLWANMNMDEEAEVRFIKNAPIFVVGVEVDREFIEINDWRRC